MIKKRCINSNNYAVTVTLESVIAVGIVVSLLAVFFYTVQTSYVVNDNPEIDLETKSSAILESLVSLQGLDDSLSTEWVGDGFIPENIKYLGFATSQVLEYGIVDKFTDPENPTIVKKYSIKNIGLAQTCFLANTKVVMADNSYKNIENIVVGDLVKSYDVKNQRIVESHVTQVFYHSPEEMGEYYLVINNNLRVTPDHHLFTDKGWAKADDLKIGDNLFSYNVEYQVYTIAKVFEKTETYNFEVEGSHNYFVVMNFDDILVHNDFMDPVTVKANFTWFDIDGLGGGTSVFLDASNSIPDSGIKYIWLINGEDSGWGDVETKLWPMLEIPEGASVTLTVETPDPKTDSVTKFVKPNKLNADPDPEPWVLSSKDVYPTGEGESFSSYGDNYNVNFTPSRNANYDVFEVKEKKTCSTPLLDEYKIVTICSLVDEAPKTYEMVKNHLGLNTSKTYYNFRVEFWIDLDSDGNIDTGESFEFGALDDAVTAQESKTREVTFYRSPTGDRFGIIDHPQYFYGEITVSVFIGGTPP